MMLEFSDTSEAFTAKSYTTIWVGGPVDMGALVTSGVTCAAAHPVDTRAASRYHFNRQLDLLIRDFDSIFLLPLLPKVCLEPPISFASTTHCISSCLDCDCSVRTCK